MENEMEGMKKGKCKHNGKHKTTKPKGTKPKKTKSGY